MNRVCKQPDFIIKRILSVKTFLMEILTSLIVEFINPNKIN